MSSEFPPVLLLAGGLGTRLGELCKNVPKAMVEVAGQPFIAHQLRLLKRQSVHRVILCLSHHSKAIEEFVGDGCQFGLAIDYCLDGERQLGTGGAVKKAAARVNGPLAVMYGDTYLDVSFAAIYAAFLQAEQPGLMTVLANENRWDKSNVFFADGKVKAYKKNNETSGMRHIDYGLSIFASSVFDSYPSHQTFDMSLVFQQLISSHQLAGYEVFQRFYEIGTPAALSETEQYLRYQGRTHHP